VRAVLEGRAAEVARDAGAEALGTARIALTSLEGWQDESNATDSARSFELRDIAMASVFEGLRQLHFPTKKAVLWAHNIHVVKHHEAVESSWVGGPIVTMGTKLERDLGSARYRAVALIGWEVSLNRDGYRGPVSPAPSGSSLEARLHAAARGSLHLDLHGQDASALVPPGRSFELGAPGVETHVPAQGYDAILYLEQSPMAELVP
jgi:erythromycin esterase-like protein